MEVIPLEVFLKNNYSPYFSGEINKEIMDLEFKARLEKNMVQAIIQEEVKKMISTIDIQQLVKNSIDSIVSNRLEIKIEDRLNGGSFLENVVKYVQKRLSKDVILDEVIRTLDKVELSKQIADNVAKNLINK